MATVYSRNNAVCLCACSPCALYRRTQLHNFAVHSCYIAQVVTSAIYYTIEEDRRDYCCVYGGLNRLKFRIVKHFISIT